MTTLDAYLREFRATLGGCDEATKRDLLEEVAGHLEERVRALQLAGASEEEAMNETVNKFGTAREVGGQLGAIHGRLSRRDALLAALPVALIGLGVGLILLFWLVRTPLVIGGTTPAWQAWKPEAVILIAGSGIIMGIVGLILVGGALVGLVRRLPPWAGPWLGVVTVAFLGIWAGVTEDAPSVDNALLELLLAAILLAWVLLPLVLTAWRDVRSGLLTGLTMSMIFAQVLVTNARALPMQRFDVALLVLPLGLIQAALLYLVARSDPVRRWMWAVSVAALALFLNVIAILGASIVWRDWRILHGRPDTSFYFASLSLFPVAAALAISVVRWGWGRWRTRLVAG